MEIARSITGRRGHMVTGDEHSPQRTNGLLHLEGRSRIGQDRDIDTGTALSLQLYRSFSRSDGDLLRQLAGRLDCFQHAGGVVFAFLDVR